MVSISMQVSCYCYKSMLNFLQTTASICFPTLTNRIYISNQEHKTLLMAMCMSALLLA